ncbi:MAG: bifunctional demethylmenaquinone methyltransferase/2-methoxy-6-polyprenyl-1,4-benzoquinol methylase UbiE [Syntrophales bacterium]|nr:bifunctional demethylmenaquinone methyltransferase/2-methoxy-6-polyprenyl-1,4-benzoquinol methylase UbiE [Syntrophales bacterium]
MEESLQMAKRIKKRYPPVHEMTPSEQVGLVREVFATIPRRYDFLNRVFSLRRDVAWRRFAVRKMRFFNTSRFLDVATGTADLAVETVRRHPPVRVAALDFVLEMMAVGRQKIRRKHMADRIRLIQGDALSLPFDDNVFDVAAIAFGIRNIPDRRRALEEMKRVVVLGGQVMALEMNFPRHPLFRRFYDLYLNRVLPRMARLFSRNPAAYRYLGDSIKEFPSPDQFARLMAEAGLTGIEKYSLTLGITYLYIGVKPETKS